MNPDLDQAKARYRETEIPAELGYAVGAALRAGERKRRSRRALGRTLASAGALCACFVLVLNLSPTFARAVYEVPVLGSLAKIFTVRQYTMEDRDHLIDVRLPALENTGSTDLEQRVNTEIQTRIQSVLDEAKERARENRDAFVSTGGQAEDFIPIIISVDYDVKCQDDRYLSFVLTKTETIASAYTEIYCYNIDLETGRELTLGDLLGPDYRSIADESIRAQIASRSQEPGNEFFDGENGVEGFQGISDQQKFYLNQTGNPVILFEKYEIAPGYMGIQEFEITR